MTVLSSQHDIRILITEAEIAARTTQLARLISDEYKDTKQLMVVGLLRGSFVFIADLVRRVDLPVEVDFMTVSSYGNAMESSLAAACQSSSHSAQNGEFGRGAANSSSDDVSSYVVADPKLLAPDD